MNFIVSVENIIILDQCFSELHRQAGESTNKQATTPTTFSSTTMSSSVNFLQLIAFVDLLAIGIIVPLTSLRVMSLGGSHIHVGLLGSIYAIFQLGSGPLVGSLSDIRSRRSVLIITLVVCGLTYMLTGCIKSIFGILFLRAVLGLFKQTQMLTRAMVPEYEESKFKQSEIFGRMAAISGMGITLGPLIGGHIIESHPEYGFTYMSLAAGILFLINTGLVYFILPEPKSIKSSRRKKGNTKRKNTYKREESQGVVHYVYQSLKQSVADLSGVDWSAYWDVFIMKALVGFAMGIYYSNYATYLAVIYKLTPKYIGYIISFQGVVGSLSSFFIGTINKLYEEDEDYSLRNLHVFALFTISIGGIMFSPNIYLYIFCLIPLAVSNAVGRLTTLEMILRRDRTSEFHRGCLIGASNSVRSLTGVVAPMATGFISHYIGVSYPIYISFLATLLGFCISYYYSRNYRAGDLSYADDECECNHRIKTE